MNALQFEHQLQRLNPRLYVGKTVTNSLNPELLSTGIYIKGWNDTERIDYSDAGLSVEDSKKAEEQNENPDKYLTWCTWRHIPEGNIYGENMRLIAKGWREIVCILADQGHFDIRKARRIFARSDLGQATYDKLPHSVKYQRQAGHG